MENPASPGNNTLITLRSTNIQPPPSATRLMSSTQKLLWLLLVATLIATAASFWEAPYPSELRLQHVPTVLGLVGLGIAVQRCWLSMSSAVCLLMFLWLHLIGARWIYSFVPYDQWCEQLCGMSLSEVFGWKRNHYDRLVHLASGILLVPPAWELIQQQGLNNRWWTAGVSISIVLAIGAVYEIFEWTIAVLLAPHYAESYNGQQGDLWDPQKDLALAGLGAVISAILLVMAKPTGPLK